MFKLFKKKIPTQDTVDVITIKDAWKVTWYSRYNEYHTGLDKEVEFFIEKKEAELFKEALENAFKLIRHTSNTTVTLSKHVMNS